MEALTATALELKCIYKLTPMDGYSSKRDVTLHRASLGECIRLNYNDVMHIGNKYWETVVKEILGICYTYV